jgi:hypothetical protein
VKKLCKKMGVKLGKKGLRQAMARMDKDGGGEVDFEEFSAWCVARRSSSGLPVDPQHVRPVGNPGGTAVRYVWSFRYHSSLKEWRFPFKLP